MLGTKRKKNDILHALTASRQPVTRPPNLPKTSEWSTYVESQAENKVELIKMYNEAVRFLEFYDWCKRLDKAYVGMFYPGILGIFLFRIERNRADVDEWLWVVVGDLPAAYLTCEDAPTPAAALDAYIGAMSEWVEAAESGRSVAKLIPVNVPATKENAELLKTRLAFLDERILKQHQTDLTS